MSNREDPTTEAIRKADTPGLPIGTPVETRDGARGTVIGADGVDHTALTVRLDRPWSEDSVDGHVCVSIDEVTVLPQEPDLSEHRPGPPIVRLPAPADSDRAQESSDE